MKSGGIRLQVQIYDLRARLRYAARSLLELDLRLMMIQVGILCYCIQSARRVVLVVAKIKNQAHCNECSLKLINNVFNL